MITVPITVPMEVSAVSPAIPISVETINQAIQVELSTEYKIYPPYDGPYDFTPGLEAQTVHTAGNYMKQDIVIEPIPNNYGLITWNGSTLTVS